MPPGAAASVLISALIWVIATAPAAAQLVPRASPTTPVEAAKLPAPGDPFPTAAWETRAPPPAADVAALLFIADAAFSDPPPADLPGTRALLIVHRGAIVYERYAEGFGQQSRFPSWSMAKTIVNAGIGLLAAEGKLALDSPAGVPQWSAAKDPRRAITVRQLLNMTSGVNWPQAPEAPAARAADVEMLFGRGRGDMAGYAASYQLANAPGAVFQYNTGSSVLLSAVIAHTVAPGVLLPTARRSAIKRFYDHRLFAPLGITSAVLEFDRSGVLVGGDYLHMTARDYARLAYLYLRGGYWEGKQILPSNWIAETRRSAAKSGSGYGAHFWLALPNEPEALLASGNNGQASLIVPSRALLIVRLGNSPAAAWPAIHAQLRDLVSRFPPI